MDFSAARGIADAVLYEGFLLYPYTASAHKNRLRWQFGVVVPRAHEAAATGEHGHQQTDVLFEAGDDARVEIVFRFLHVEARVVEAHANEAFVPVAKLVVDGKAYLTFDESIEREVRCTYDAATPEGTAHAVIAFEAARTVEELRDATGALAGRVVRERWPLAGSVTVSATPCVPGGALWRLRVRVENESAIVAAPERGVVLRTAFVSGHTLLAIEGGAFLSPLDPPERATSSTTDLRNEHTWPVLVGDAAADCRRAALVLSSPIILADFPAIATKTDCDAFDGTEIDELLTLSVLSLSDAERAEARATDARARAIVERAEAFGASDVKRLHATFDVPEFEVPHAPAPQEVTIGGNTVRQGSSVRLAPKRRADAWDMFLTGKVATVQKIHQDFEDRIYVAVTVDDDPASEYHEWYGRSFFFDTDEVEVLGSKA